jgi:hypothetical protein
MAKDDKMSDVSMGCMIRPAVCKVCGEEVGIITHFEAGEVVSLWCPIGKRMTPYLVRPAMRPMCVGECCCPTISMDLGPCVRGKEKGQAG